MVKCFSARRFLFGAGQFLGLSGQAWQAVKYSVGREGLRRQRIAAGRKPPLSSRPSEARAGTHNHQSPFLNAMWPRRAQHICLWLWIPGRARFARLPGTTAELRTRLRIPAARFRVRVLREQCPSKSRGRRECRALNRTRNPRGLKRKMPTSRQAGPKSHGTPCAMVLRLLRALLGVPGLLAPVVCRLVIERLSTSVGVPGPRGLTVRIDIARLRYQCVHRIPHHVS
jgi:hypothetical protein